MKTIFITRIEAKNIEDLKNQPGFIELITEVYSSDIKNIYAISNLEDSEVKIGGIPVTIIQDTDPISPTSINTILYKIKNKPDAFLICSKEVVLRRNNIKTLIREIENNDRLLVSGYKFMIKDRKLNDELQNYYNNNDLIAYRVPWNTCAIWNNKLFEKYVVKFDEITSRKPFNQIYVCVDNVCSITDQKGMEDGLAIAKASSQKDKPKVYFKLLHDFLFWEIKSDYKKRIDHRKKLARKDIVLRSFMEEKDYLTEDLINAEIKNYN